MKAWYNNLRSFVPNWAEISTKIRSKCTCEICGYRGEISEFDAHEVWKYDDKDHVQSLSKIMCVCKPCHSTIHIGLSGLNGTLDQSLQHYQEVNGLTKEEVNLDYAEAGKVYHSRSMFEWTLDKEKLIKDVESLTGISCDLSKPVNGRYYENVPFDLKDTAKSFGARWDSERKMWYFMSEEARTKWKESNK